MNNIFYTLTLECTIRLQFLRDCKNNLAMTLKHFPHMSFAFSEQPGSKAFIPKTCNPSFIARIDIVFPENLVCTAIPKCIH